MTPYHGDEMDHPILQTSGSVPGGAAPCEGQTRGETDRVAAVPAIAWERHASTLRLHGRNEASDDLAKPSWPVNQGSRDKFLLMIEVACHEVGHTLGLRHTLAGSFIFRRIKKTPGH
jgi:hypothetical protein